MVRLCELGELRTGFQLREAVRHEPRGANTLVQLGDVRADEILLRQLVRMDLPRARPRDFIAPGDLLLRGRGSSYGAAVVPESCPPETVAVAPLYVLRLSPDTPVALPGYLAWFINRPETQMALAAQARGSSIPTVSIQSFAALPVALPPLEEQQRIAAVETLRREEKALTLKLLEQREALLRAVLEERLKAYMPPIGDGLDDGSGDDLDED